MIADLAMKIAMEKNNDISNNLPRARSQRPAWKLQKNKYKNTKMGHKSFVELWKRKVLLMI